MVSENNKTIDRIKNLKKFSDRIDRINRILNSAFPEERLNDPSAFG
jgi:hypothetical protein